MRRLVTVTVLALSLGVTSQAIGCSCADDPSTREALDKASEVFLAQVTYVTHMAVPDDPDHGWNYLEIAAFRVLEVWKGPLKAGDIIQAAGWSGPGGCGLRIAEDPRKPFSPGEQSRPAPYRRPGLWVIYRDGSSPYRVSACTRTKPFESGGEQEATRLRELMQPRAKK